MTLSDLVEARKILQERIDLNRRFSGPLLSENQTFKDFADKWKIENGVSAEKIGEINGEIENRINEI